MDYSMPGSPVLHYDIPQMSSISQSLLKFMFIELVMLSNHLILWCSLLLLPSIFPRSGSFPVSQNMIIPVKYSPLSSAQDKHSMTVGHYYLTLWRIESISYLKNLHSFFKFPKTWLHVISHIRNLKKYICDLQETLAQFSSAQSLSHVRLFATPWIAARQASLSITNSQSSLRLTSIESVMPSSHLILCRLLLLLPPISPIISLFQWVNSSHEVARILEFQL